MIINILSNKSVWKFLVLLSYSPGAGYTRKEVLELLKWNNLSLDRTIKKLLFYKVIIKQGRLIKLNFASEETQKLLEIINEDKKKLNFPSFELFVILAEFLRLIEPYDLSEVYLFGSQAKKTATVSSDIDLAIFSEQKVNLIEAKDSIMQGFNKEIQLHYFQPVEKNKITEEIKKHGVNLL